MIPKTNDKELAFSEGSLFSPRGLITKPWAIALSNYSIFTPTLYYVDQQLPGLFII
jgi:hypothetical protein